MPSDPQGALDELSGQVMRLGLALGLTPDDGETAAAFAHRCSAAARMLRLSAGITWGDYVLSKAEKGEAVFVLKELPESSALGGPRWTITVNQGLEELAGKLGMYEDGISP